MADGFGQEGDSDVENESEEEELDDSQSDEM
jgi:hypothetical protein